VRRAACRVLCDTIIARLARFLTHYSETLSPLQPPPGLSKKESPAPESGTFDLGRNSDDQMERLAPAAVSAAVTSTAAVSTAGMSAAKVAATVRAAEASMRRESARPAATAAAETTSAWRT
jgi:hypothetical protein